MLAVICAEVSSSSTIEASFTPERLIAFALEQMPSMHLPDGTFCVEVVKGGEGPIGRSPRYTLMCLLGLHRASWAGYDVPFDLPAMTEWSLGAPDPELMLGDFGLRLWLACRSGNDVSRAIDELVRRCDPDLLRHSEGMQLAWIVIGTGYAVAAGYRAATGMFRLASSELIGRRQAAGGLILQSGVGRRARFPNFATQIYSLLALATVVRLDLDARAGAGAERLARALLRLQRADGGWPWVFDVQRSSVVEPYHLYAVHQDAMAPMAYLELSEALDDCSYRDVALQSLTWLEGHNDLGRRMMDEQARLIYRSIRRPPPLNRMALYVNTALAYAGRGAVVGYGGPLEINPTDRPYHLGWVLEAWCGRI